MQDGAELHELRRARKRRPLPIPASACEIISAFALREPNTLMGVQFSLRRRKEGTEVTLSASVGQFRAFNWNLSHMLDHYPPSFAAARKWVAAYAAGYGQVVEEAPPSRPRMKRPVGNDRKLLKAGGCRESWLASDVPELWAEAVVRCQHAGGYCGQDGFCHFGDCAMEMNVSCTQGAECEAR